MRGGREEVIIPPGAAAGALYSAPSLLFGFGFVFNFSRRRLREACRNFQAATSPRVRVRGLSRSGAFLRIAFLAMASQNFCSQTPCVSTWWRSKFHRNK